MAQRGVNADAGEQFRGTCVLGRTGPPGRETGRQEHIIEGGEPFDEMEILEDQPQVLLAPLRECAGIHLAEIVLAPADAATGRFDAGQAVVTPAIWKGTSPTIKVGRDQSVVVAVPNGMAAKVKTQLLRNDPLIAPIAQGKQVATLRVTAGDLPVIDVPLLALDGVEQAGVVGRAWDAIRLWIR